MSEMIGNIVVCCSECHASGVPHVGRYVWFRNQYGARVRVFCYRCGTVTEKVEKKGIVTTERKPWKTKILYPLIPEEEFPF